MDLNVRHRASRIWTLSRPHVGTCWSIVSKTLSGFSRDRGELVAAALAYYTLLSIAPLIIIAVAIAGAVLGTGAARQEVARVLIDAMGTDAASTVDGWVEQAAAGGGVASVVGLALVLFAASRLGTQLRSSLNHIWNIDVTGPQGLSLIIADYFKQRAFAFLVVLASGPLLLLVFASRALLSGFQHYLFADSTWSGVVVQGVQLLSSVSVVALISAAIFRFVPDRKVLWKSAAWGGLLTSLLFNVGNVLVGLYLARAGVGAAYGAAGSAVVLLLWLQFSAHMFLLGAEFTQQLQQHLAPDTDWAAQPSPAGRPRRVGHPRGDDSAPPLSSTA
jgi:membrane protein